MPKACSAVIDMDHEFRQYIATALWSSTDPASDSDCSFLDRDYGIDDFAPDTLAELRAEFEAFIAGTDPALLDYWQRELGDGQIGHDFWLTRNGHGAGFWDRFGPHQLGGKYGRLLTDESRPYGSCDLYIGDDGKVYAS